MYAEGETESEYTAPKTGKQLCRGVTLDLRFDALLVFMAAPVRMEPCLFPMAFGRVVATRCVRGMEELKPESQVFP